MKGYFVYFLWCIICAMISMLFLNVKFEFVVIFTMGFIGHMIWNWFKEV